MDPYHFAEITCPETGRPITVRRTLDAIGRLFATGQISEHQRAAAEAYQADVEASSLRAPSRGPDDVSGWRSRRPDGNSKRARRLRRADVALTPDQAAVVKGALAGRKLDIRQLSAALNELAVVYGMATVTKH